MKNKNRKQKDTPPISDLKLTVVGKKIIQPIFWTIVVVVGLWSLMHFSTPEKKLEPYTQFKKQSTAFKSNDDEKVKPELERFTQSKQPKFSNISSQNSEA